MLKFLKKFFGHNEETLPTDVRTAIKTQVAPDAEPDLELSEFEQKLADRFEALPGRCKRRGVHEGVNSWSTLERFCTQHEIVGHSHK